MLGMLLLSALAVASSIDKSLVDGVVKRHYNQIRYCYEKRLPQNPELEGTVKIRFRLESDGTIAYAEVADSTVDDAEVAECVRSLFLTWIWPSGRIFEVTYPFVFKKKPPKEG